MRLDKTIPIWQRLCDLLSNRELRVASYKNKVTSYELQSMSYNTKITRYELQHESHELRVKI